MAASSAVHQNGSLDVDFEGVIPANTRCEIVKEFVKYILYERSQIPMYYNDIKECLRIEQKKLNNKVDQRKSSLSSNRDQLLFIEKIEALFDTISDAFSLVTPIKEILVILGSSIMNPKDCYHICFPTDFYEGKILSQQTCMQKIFRELVTSGFMADAKPMTCTSLFVLFLAPRNCLYRLTNLLPKVSFSIPSRGAKYSINISFSGVVPGNNNISFSSSEEANLSGIQTIDVSAQEEDLSVTETSSSAISSPNSLPVLHVIRNKNDTGIFQLVDEMESEDYIWFQAPSIVKGYKDKASDFLNALTLQ